jgi:hypothetical protein
MPIPFLRTSKLVLIARTSGRGWCGKKEKADEEKRGRERERDVCGLSLLTFQKLRSYLRFWGDPRWFESDVADAVRQVRYLVFKEGGMLSEGGHAFWYWPARPSICCKR